MEIDNLLSDERPVDTPYIGIIFPVDGVPALVSDDGTGKPFDIGANEAHDQMFKRIVNELPYEWRVILESAYAIVIARGGEK